MCLLQATKKWANEVIRKCRERPRPLNSCYSPNCTHRRRTKLAEILVYFANAHNCILAQFVPVRSFNTAYVFKRIFAMFKNIRTTINRRTTPTVSIKCCFVWILTSKYSDVSYIRLRPLVHWRHSVGCLLSVRCRLCIDNGTYSGAKSLWAGVQSMSASDMCSGGAIWWMLAR